MSYVNEVFDSVKLRDPEQVEFHQAVWEVLETLEPVFDKHPEYKEAKILERLTDKELTECELSCNVLNSLQED